MRADFGADCRASGLASVCAAFADPYMDADKFPITEKLQQDVP
jgi:hypothetical protein